MKLAVVISTDDSEAIWNALRLANFAIQAGDEVKVFLVGRGVDYEKLSTEQFNLIEQAEEFVKSEKAEILACGTCLRLRNQEGGQLCPLSTLQDLYNLVKESDKVLSF